MTTPGQFDGKRSHNPVKALHIPNLITTTKKRGLSTQDIGESAREELDSREKETKP